MMSFHFDFLVTMWSFFFFFFLLQKKKMPVELYFVLFCFLERRGIAWCLIIHFTRYAHSPSRKRRTSKDIGWP